MDVIAGPRLPAVLAGAGFLAVPRLGRGSHRAFHAPDETTGRWAKLDIVTRIDLGPYQELRTTLAAGFLVRRRPSSGVQQDWRPDDDDAFWALLLHELFDRPSPAVRRPDVLRGLAAGARPDGPAARAIEALLQPLGETPAHLLDLVRGGDTPSLLRAGARMRRRLGPRVRGRRGLVRVIRWLDRRDPPFVRRGVSVALLGPDGAGKSTLCAGLGAGGPLPVRSVYLGLYGGRHGGTSRRSFPGIGFVGRVLRMWRGWLVGRIAVARGRIVVFDRHPYDARLSTGDRGDGRTTSARTRRSGLVRAALGRSLPRPDLVVVLDAPAELLYARKPEHPMERVEAQRTAYLDLASRLPGAEVVDVSGSTDDVVRRVTGLVWRHLAARESDR
ncbi:MAG: hypothetical protein WEG56_01400 [Chloroflexota bacterium]